MALDSDEILVGANGSLAVAPVGSTMPTDATTDLDAAFIDLGYLTDDGAAWKDTKSVAGVPAWQSYYDVRKIVESRANMISGELLQWNKSTLALAFGGGTITEPVSESGEFQYDPPDPEDLDERAVCLTWADGTRNYRLIYWRAFLTSDIEVMFKRSEAAKMPFEFEALPHSTNPIYRLLTDDAAIDPA